MYYSGFNYLGKHSGRDMGLTIANREFETPNKIKRIKRPPFSNKDIDFSELYGSQVYSNKTIKYQINIFNQRIRNKHEMNTLKTKVVNWLMNSNGKQKLYDDYYYGYYFLAEVEDGASFKENWLDGTLDVTFTCYPFMISDLPEGHDIWDETNFALDVFQPTQFELDGEYTFKELSIGSEATIGAWATMYASGGGKIPLRNIGLSGTITGIENVTTSRSKRAYSITGIDGLVVEQDIIQAHSEPLEITLVNPGTPSVTPLVNLERKATIVKGNRAYNFVEGGNYKNDDFQLESGENKLLIYSFHQNNIEFNFHKELI